MNRHTATARARELIRKRFDQKYKHPRVTTDGNGNVLLSVGNNRLLIKLHPDTGAESDLDGEPDGGLTV